ncbi:MAG: hypothetical protein BWK77_01565 [Verrucomicrobia bacterium A1]|nr:MAG: hypothetical protein BWK77_01565 [Verrucomicrobia bacterium A1]
MIQNPIVKVLSTMRARKVRCLLMGGQACVLYGGAEFSRDVDFALLASAENFLRLKKALADLQAIPIAVPPMRLQYLRRGHALHFRCGDTVASGLRIDVMSSMRGADAFPALWRRRTTVELPGGLAADLLSLPDLVRAKKTQRDKDWPMIRRLLEFDYLNHRRNPTAAQVRFWLLELRTPILLRELAGRSPSIARRLATRRPLLRAAWEGADETLVAALKAEEDGERRQDEAYWRPLRRELEAMRHAAARKAGRK